MKLMKTLLIAGALSSASMLAIGTSPVAAQEQSSYQLTEDQLGQVLAALSLEPTKQQERYDFTFETILDEQEWSFTMSAILSQDSSDVWLMAWLDELPKSSAGVPKTALLQLLAQNDKLGNGKFFAYIPTTRRFVLQRTISNQNLTSAKVNVALQDLAASVVLTHPVWFTGNWNPTGIPSAPIGGAAPATTQPAQSAANESKFGQPIRK